LERRHQRGADQRSTRRCGACCRTRGHGRPEGRPRRRSGRRPSKGLRLMRTDGRAIAATITEQVRDHVMRLKNTGVEPKVGILTATDDVSTAYYVRSIVRAA